MLELSIKLIDQSKVPENIIPGTDLARCGGEDMDVCCEASESSRSPSPASPLLLSRQNTSALDSGDRSGPRREIPDFSTSGPSPHLLLSSLYTSAALRQQNPYLMRIDQRHCHTFCLKIYIQRGYDIMVVHTATASTTVRGKRRRTLRSSRGGR